MVTYAQASAAGPIKAAIDDETTQTGAMTAFTNSSAQIVAIDFSTLDGRVYHWSGTSFSVSESAGIFNQIFTVFNNRLTASNSQLAAV